MADINLFSPPLREFIMCKLKLFFSLINTIAIIAVCRIFGFSGMPNTYTFNIGADIVSLAICTVLLYSIIQDKECYGEHTRTFELLIFGMSFTLSSDAFFWLVQGVPELKLVSAPYGQNPKATNLPLFYERALHLRNALFLFR